MAAMILPQATRQPLRQLAASILARSPIFLSPSSSSATTWRITSSSQASTSALPVFALPSLASLVNPDTLASLRELLPPWVLAVPKSKTTHSAKRMRSANKGLKEQQNIVACPSCGTPKMSHHLCHECHVAFRREYHAEAKEAAKRAEGGIVDSV